MSDLGQISTDFNVPSGPCPETNFFMPSDPALEQKFMPSGPALKQKFSCPLALPWNKTSCPLALPWNKTSCPLALPWNKTSWPSGPTLPYTFIDIISSFLTYHHNSVKSRLQGVWLPESLIWRFWLLCCLKMRERGGRIGTCSACLPNSASRTLLLGQWG
jgi:hypothetical protein